MTILSSESLTDVTAAPSLMEDVWFKTNTNSAEYPKADVLRNINNWYKRVLGWAWEASGDWEADDSTYTTFAIADATIVNNQRDYSLPAELLAIKRVEIKNTSGDWYKLQYWNEQESELGLMNEDAGTPLYYGLTAQSIILYPKPDISKVTAASGLRIHYSRDINAFDNTDASESPGFAPHLHEILALGATHDWFSHIREYGAADRTMVKIEGMKRELQKLYSVRNQEHQQGIRPQVLDYE